MKIHSATMTAIGIASTMFVGCNNAEGGGAGGRPPNPDEIPAAVAIAGGHLSSGIAIADLRVDVNVEAFRIGQSPVTVAYYKDCVSAGACSAPNLNTAECQSSVVASGVNVGLHRSTYGSSGNDQVPITCVTPDQAKTYCHWVGGTLPSAEQWQLAARGELPQRYAWGNQPATCAQRADALGLTPSTSCCATAKNCSDPGLLVVGAHATGASPSGVQDILLTQAELLSPSPSTQFSACSNSGHSCAVTGIGGGAIDGFRAFENPPKGDAGSGNGLPDVGFRCAWSAQ